MEWPARITEQNRTEQSKAEPPARKASSPTIGASPSSRLKVKAEGAQAEFCFLPGGAAANQTIEGFEDNESADGLATIDYCWTSVTDESVGGGEMKYFVNSLTFVDSRQPGEGWPEWNSSHSWLLLLCGAGSLSGHSLAPARD